MEDAMADFAQGEIVPLFLEPPGFTGNYMMALLGRMSARFAIRMSVDIELHQVGSAIGPALGFTVFHAINSAIFFFFCPVIKYHNRSSHEVETQYFAVAKISGSTTIMQGMELPYFSIAARISSVYPIMHPLAVPMEYPNPSPIRST
jgi:hypothetical protein